MKKFVFCFSNKGKRSFLALSKEARSQIEEKLKSVHEEFRYRIGNYRAIFRKDDQGNFVFLVILKVGHRKEVYKK